MNDPLDGITTALACVDATWGMHSGGDRAPANELAATTLVEVNDALGVARRHLEAVHASVASEIARRSRAELGPEGLAKQHGFRSPTALIAATTGTTMGDAGRLVAVGEATTPRMTFSGAPAPARHPFVGAGMAAGTIGTLAASAIISMLDRVALRADCDELPRVEALLVAQAAGLTAEQLAKVIARAEAVLDPAGLERKENELHVQRSLTMFERAGMLHLNIKLGAAGGAPVKTAIEAMVTAEFRHEVKQSAIDPGATRRTLPQRQADALVLLATHALGCAQGDLPLEGATVIVRMSLADLESGNGIATIDGLAQPVSVATARRMAASGGVIPCVLDSHGMILDWGRERRLFTRTQKLALVERDGGCAMCGLPPGMTKVHHLRWWKRDHGRTDLENGVLLCESCHHRIHDNGWEIHIDGAGVHGKVWFVPPSHVDPGRTPRAGGRARYDFVA